MVSRHDSWEGQGTEVFTNTRACLLSRADFRGQFPKDLSRASGERQATPEDNSWDLKETSGLECPQSPFAPAQQQTSDTGSRQLISSCLEMVKPGTGPQGENAAFVSGLRGRVGLPTGLDDLSPWAVPLKAPPVATKPDTNFYLEKTGF